MAHNRNKDLLIHSYDVAIERLARLIPFFSCGDIQTESEVYTIADRLFLDDMIMFSISFRRLVDVCGARSDLKNYKVNGYVVPGRISKSGSSYIGVVEACGIVVHSNRINLIRTRRESYSNFASEFDLEEYFKIGNEPVERSFIYVESDNRSMIMFCDSLIEVFDKALRFVVDEIQDRNIFLETEFR